MCFYNEQNECCFPASPAPVVICPLTSRGRKKTQTRVNLGEVLSLRLTGSSEVWGEKHLKNKPSAPPSHSKAARGLKTLMSVLLNTSHRLFNSCQTAVGAFNAPPPPVPRWVVCSGTFNIRDPRQGMRRGVGGVSGGGPAWCEARLFFFFYRAKLRANYGDPAWTNQTSGWCKLYWWNGSFPWKINDFQWFPRHLTRHSILKIL